MERLVILGGGNGFWEVLELVRDINDSAPSYEVVAVLDDRTELRGKRLAGIPVHGTIDVASSFQDDVRFVCAIASPAIRLEREAIVARAGVPESRFATLVHPRAKVFSTASLGVGCIVHCHSVIFSHTRVGPFVLISANNVIGTNNLIGRGALLASSIATTDRVRIGNCAHVGQGVLISEGREVGPGAQVGMGSVVLKDIAPGAFVLGFPPRFIDRVEVSPVVLAEWEDAKAAFLAKQGWHDA